MIEKDQPNKYIRDYVEGDNTPDWIHTQVAKDLYQFGSIVSRYLIAPRNETQPRLPQPLVGIEKMRVETLAAYRLVPNANGLPYEVLLNEVWIKRPMWELYESLTHEMIHLYQEWGADQGLERFKDDPLKKCTGGYHNNQFVEICEEIGLHPMIGVGAHWRPADGQFGRLMGLLGVEEPEYAKGGDFVMPPAGTKKPGYWWDDNRGKKKGSSTLTLYTTDVCVREPQCKVRAGKKDLNIVCADCDGAFIPHT